ncbi:Lysozyme inhibitor LprI, N-terminal [Caulobacteraceae bacterium]
MSQIHKIAAGLVGLALTTSVATWLSPAHAQENVPKPKAMAAFRVCLAASKTGVDCGQPVYDACQADHDQPDTTLSIIECTMTTHKAWDVVLNERYRALIATSPPNLKLKLQKAQRAWIVSRDADCAAVYENWISGTIRGPMYAGCMVEKTSERAQWLKEMRED